MPAKKTNKSKKNDSVKLKVTLAVLAALALTFILLAILWEPFEAENMTTYSTGLVGTYLHSRSVSDNVASAVSVLMFVIVSVAAYMLGSMNFAIMTSKALYNEDIRNYGSKNAGMTNMFRVYGKKAGFFQSPLFKANSCKEQSTYLNLRLRAASDFFLRLTEGFS